MATRLPSDPASTAGDEDRADPYDETVEDSFPASDPPAGVIKVGPRRTRPSPVAPLKMRPSPPSNPN